MKPFSVLHLISSTLFLGAERVIAELAKGSSPTISKVHVGLMGDAEGIKDAFVEAISRNDIPICTFVFSGKVSPKAINAICVYIEDNNIDIIHSHGYKADIFSLLISKCCNRDVKLVASCHTWKLRTVREKYYKSIDLFVLRYFDCIVAISSEIQTILSNSRIDQGKIKVVLNGVNILPQTTDVASCIYNEVGIKPSELVIGSVSSLTVEKAQHDLLKAFSQIVYSRRYGDVRCILVGDGDQRSYLERLAEELGVRDRVVFTGYRNDARHFYSIFDVFALVSYAEGLPMAMLEAMAVGVPVIASRVGAIPDVINDRGNGILVKPGDIGAIVEALGNLAEHPEIRRQLGAKGKEKVEVDLSSERMCREYDQLYNFVLGRVE